MGRPVCANVRCHWNPLFFRGREGNPGAKTRVAVDRKVGALRCKGSDQGVRWEGEVASASVPVPVPVGKRFSMRSRRFVSSTYI